MEQYLSEYKGKNILITGGAGCIGSNLTKALIKAEEKLQGKAQFLLAV